MKEDKGCETAGKEEAAMSSSSQAEKLRHAAVQGDVDQVKTLLDAGTKIEPDLVSKSGGFFCCF